ncbi:S9 family peptidase [Pacificimonas sp. WHA3]|uniref:S9 family peptidase n=2 Tax=Pacificimonas pallii TaxID=2827236 RepID=A0ABS6SIG7_9SPHN|nr:S9 family peptidase [Pacificimonas pallii]
MASAGTAASAKTAAQNADLIPREALLGNPTKSQGRISPDGKWLSWLAPKDGVMNVWVAPAADPADARAVTDDAKRGINSHMWTPDSLFILTQQDKGGDENFHVYATDIANGATIDLTPAAEGVRAVIQNVSRERPGVVLIGMNDRDPQLFDLYEVNYSNGEKRLVAENPGFGGWVVDHQNRARLGMISQPGGGADYFLVEPDGTQGEKFMSVGTDDFFNTQPFAFSKDGERLYLGDSRNRNTSALAYIDLTTGTQTTLGEHENADVSDVMFHPTTYEPLAYAVNYKKEDWTALSDDVAGDLEFLKSRFKGQINLASATDDNRKWVVVDDAAEQPGTYMLYDRDTKSLTEMFTTRPELADAPLQPMHPLVIKARDGLELVSYLTLPPGSDPDGDGRPDEAVPTLLWVHGGPWARDGYGYDTVHQWMANRGYAVLSVNYRGSTGFGKDHVNRAIGEWSGAMHDDLIDAVDWAIEEGIAQADKVAIGGGSYGGYATLVGVTFTPDKFACGVDIVGPSNLITLMESFPPYWRPILEGTFYRHIGDPADAEARADLVARSPLTHVDKIKVPLLIGQGGNDPRVTKIESDQISDAMQAKGLPVTYINYPDEGHGFQEPANRLSFFAAMEGFLGQCLGGRVEPIGDDFDGSSAEVIAGAEYVEGLAEAVSSD